ncbi:MAG: hypothetical protein B6D64_04110 [Bacteroidetes bacterium 4484_276]|nr:MAG: hypothetical protein B6D64_04110 [Bacteroidetes bacterium 4484_276]
MQKLLSIIFIFVIVISGKNTWGQTVKHPTFGSITNEDGLSQGSVTSICKDQCGIMWFGTHDGLNRYDGNSFEVFRNNPDDTSSISSNNISALLYADGFIWVGTEDNGLNKFDPRTETFERIVFFNPNHEIINNLSITNLLKDQEGAIWAGTKINGLLYIDPTTNNKETFPVKVPSSGNDNVGIIDIEPDGELIWIATFGNGLIKYLPGQGIIGHFYNREQKPGPDFDSLYCVKRGDDGYLWLGGRESFLHKFNTNTEESNSIICSPKNDLVFRSVTAMQVQGDSLWIGTLGGGLHLYHIQSGKSELFSAVAHPKGINFNSLLSLYLDDTKMLWVGTNGKGLNMYHQGTSKFTVFSSDESLGYKIDVHSIRAILEVDGDLLTGGYFGVNRINSETGKKSYFLPNISVYSFCRDAMHDELVWIGTEGISLFNYNMLNGKLNYLILKRTTDKGEEIRIEFYYEIVHYKDDIYFLGTRDGLGVFNSTMQKLTAFYFHDPENTSSINKGEVKSILITPENKIWIGTTGGGISEFDFENGLFTRAENDNIEGSVSSGKVLSLFSGSDKTLWAGTDRGLHRFNDDGPVTTFTTVQGLPNDIIYGILGDKNGCLYLSTNNGLSYFNPQEISFVNFTVKDGLPNNEFNTAAFHQGTSGRFYFGGVSGMISFLPEQLNVPLPPLRPLFSKLYNYNDEMELDTLLSYKSIVTIKPGANFLTFELSAQNYLFPDENYFQYQIPELSNKWINLGRNRTLSFIDQAPGTYNIWLRASMDEVKWQSTGKPLKVIILPWFYETLWFKISFVLLCIAIFSGIFLIRVKFLKQQKDKLKTLVGERTGELQNTNLQLNDEIDIRKKTEHKLREANTTKDKFFSILAHDLRNPFNALLGFSELLSNQWDDFDDNQKLEMVRAIKTNSENTYNLLVNLLDWSRLQRGKMEPLVESVNLYETTNGILMELKGNFELKKQDIQNKVSTEISVSADQFMLATIIRNLISNAIKFTPVGGSIIINSTNNPQSVVCSIIDTGIGMDETTRKKIFDVGSTQSTKGTNGETGTGLGLMIAYEFTNLMQGKLWVESKPGEGSEFHVLLPKA